MKKLMVYLDNDMRDDLRLLAFRKRTTMAALVRYALDKTFEEEMDVIAGERALEEYAASPAAAVTLDEYLEKRGIALQSGVEPARRTRSRQVAEGRRPTYRARPGRSGE
jgi:hypothetical protein